LPVAVCFVVLHRRPIRIHIKNRENTPASEPHALAQRMLNRRLGFMTPRWSFPPRSATGHLGGIDRIECDESCKMIESEVIVGPLKAPAARGAGNREPDRPGVAAVEAASRRHGVIFSRFLRPSDPAACLRQRGPCGKNRPPVEAFWADSPDPGMLP
jgi:hypothetical protein